MHFHFYLYSDDMPAIEYQVFIFPDGKSIFEPEYALGETVNVVVEAGDHAEYEPTAEQVTAFYAYIRQYPGCQVTFHWQE